MSGTGELREKLEHASSHGHAHAGYGKQIGITMAMLGVLLALCAALVGSERAELVKSMVEQTNTYNEFQTESMKYRLSMAQLQLLHALTPSKPEVEKFESGLEAMKAQGKPEDAEIMDGLKLTATEIADVLSPDHDDLRQVAKLVHKYGHERELAHKWAESYDPVIHGHFHSAEWYENAQLAAEIGIVIASIGLLLSNRFFWWISIAAGVVCAGLIGVTYVRTHRQAVAEETTIEEAKKDYQEARARGNSKKDDEDLLKAVEQTLLDGGFLEEAGGAPH
jgi:hypothetical protein